MKYRIDMQSQKPAYLQLYEQLREDVVSGVLPRGHRLPSKRLLSEEVGVSVITVEHAYALLSDEGYICARERSGHFVSYSEGEVFSTPAAQSGPVPHTVRETGEGNFPFSVFAGTVRRVLSEYGEALLVKSPNCGCDELRGALAGYLARSRGIKVTPEQIIIGSGAEYLYGFVVNLLGREGAFAIEDPSYEKIEQV
jgi:GntR family transcriptional regulator/MocR family aminotransferase